MSIIFTELSGAEQEFMAAVYGIPITFRKKFGIMEHRCKIVGDNLDKIFTRLEWKKDGAIKRLDYVISRKEISLAKCPAALVCGITKQLEEAQP